MLYIIFFITTLYCILITAFIIGFEKVKISEGLKTEPKNSFSILIPFRNEAENLPQILDSLSKLNYPKNLFEIILINDASTDNSSEIINNTTQGNFKVINNIRKSDSPKKDAIETAIHQSKYDWIITTDADCMVPESWLIEYDSFLQINDSKMVCGPVTYMTNYSFLEQFQLMDFISLIGVTIGGFGIKKPFLCNGANLCYSKKTFYKVNGYQGNNTIASGDDIFLLEKINHNYSNQVHYLKSKEAIVITKPESTFNTLVSQRLRWASKTSSYKNWFGKFIAIFGFLMNLSIVFLFGLMLVENKFTFLFILIFLIKFILDSIIVFKTLSFSKQITNMFFYPISTFFYPFFIVFISFLSFFRKKYGWKERIFNA